MIQKQPPAFAAWMLKHFGSGPDTETLLGDLAEQYLKKNSALWYWRQALGGIVVSFFKEILGHKWIAVRALLTGLVVWAVCEGTIRPLLFPFLSHHPAPLSVFVRVVAIPLFTGAFCSWVVARFHRSQRTAVVLLFALTITFLYVQLLWRIASFLRALGASHGLWPNLYGPSAQFVAAILGIFLGGGLLWDHSMRPPGWTSNDGDFKGGRAKSR